MERFISLQLRETTDDVMEREEERRDVWLNVMWIQLGYMTLSVTLSAWVSLTDIFSWLFNNED